MTPLKTSRGRPKGTGLNDADQLLAIAGLLTTDPHLKPTTAIRQLGIQDPSVIRRLRDKFNACQAELMAELRAGAAAPLHVFPRGGQADAQTEPDSRPHVIGDEAGRIGSRAIALSAPDNPRISQPIIARAPKAAVPVKAVAKAAATPSALEIEAQPAASAARVREPRAIPLPSETKLPEWIGVGLSVYVMSMEAQFAVIGTLFEWPPLAAVLRSQVAFAEMAVAASRPGFSHLGLAAQVRP